MRLLTKFGYFAADLDVLIFPIHAAEGVTGQAMRSARRGGDDHSAVQTARQGKSDRLPPIEITRQNAGESFLELLVIGFRRERREVFPLLFPKVSLLLDWLPRLEGPGRARRQE